MMSISSAYNSILSNMQASLQQYQNSAEAIASMDLQDPGDVVALAAASSDMMAAEKQVTAAAKVAKSQNEFMGSLIDTFA